MTDIVDFKIEQMKRDAGNGCKIVMPDGSFWFKYSAEYIFQEAKFSFDFWAQTDEEAQERIEAIAATAQLDGRIVDEVPA